MGLGRKVQATDLLVRVPQIGANQITWTKPDASPFGDASHRPDGSANAMTRNGERAMKSRQCLSSRPSGFFKARALGAPWLLRNCCRFSIVSTGGPLVKGASPCRSPNETSIGFVGGREYHSRGVAGDFAQWVSWFAVRSAPKGAISRI